MTGTNGGTSLREKLGPKDRMFDWLYSQGVSTVLLFLLVWALWQTIPAAIDRHYTDLNEMRLSHEGKLESIEESQTDQIKIVCDAHAGICRELTHEIRDLSESQQEANRAVIAAVKEIREGSN